MIHTNIPKNQAFTVLLQSAVAFSNATSYTIEPSNGTDLAVPTPQIVKDGGSFVACTNAAVFVAAGIARITLTADEMNADKIEIYIAQNTAEKFSMAAVIYTDGYNPSSGSGATPEEIWTYATRSLTGASGDAISMDDVVDGSADVPTGDLTVRQILELLAKRFQRAASRKI